MNLRTEFENIKCYNTRPVDLADSQVDKCVIIAKQFAIDFYSWMMENDTQEKACEWFGYSDEDMLNKFLENKL